MSRFRNYDEVKYIMDNIFVGCRVKVKYDDDIHIVTSLKDCKFKIELYNENRIDEVCKMCIGEIGLDGNESDCQILGGGFESIDFKIIKLYNEFFNKKDFEI